MPQYLKNRVAFVGEIGSGKSYMSQWLEKHHNYKVFSFAHELKEIATKYYNMKKGSKDRKLLQTLGDAMRSVDKDVFAHYALKRISAYEEDFATALSDKRVVIDDLRFENEYAALRSVEGVAYVIIRVTSRLKASTEQDEHQSETQSRSLGADYEIKSGDFQELIRVLSGTAKNTRG